MTMPTLMNCPHSGDGWCLDCVSKLTTALKFYADREAWKAVETGIGMCSGDAVDYGHTAREALGMED